jgi:hypothetical protein
VRRGYRAPSAAWCMARLLLGAVQYRATGRTPDRAYQSLISLFCRSGGSSNDALSRLIGVLYPPYEMQNAQGVLGRMDDLSLARLKHGLVEDGFLVFERCLAPQLCDRLEQFALTNSCTALPTSDAQPGAKRKVVGRYDRDRPQAVRYEFSTQDVIDNPDVQGLMADQSFIALTQSYLGSKPVCDVMTMWWHTAFSKQPDKDAAQFWHFDMDRIKWLKFFVYLTDVGPENGPHCFVKGSHKTGGIAATLRAKGYSRLTDEEVNECYPLERIVEFCAPRGTVVVEDTRGLHKGKHVQSGDRLMLQLQFSNSLFGGYYPATHFSRVADAQLRAIMARYPKIFATYSG